MAVSRAKKVEQVDKLGAELKKVSSLVIATYTKLTVAQDFELRKTLRSSGAKYRVVKNTLAARAAKDERITSFYLARILGANARPRHAHRSGQICATSTLALKLSSPGEEKRIQ